jgi:hypothetical protein
VFGLLSHCRCALQLVHALQAAGGRDHREPARQEEVPGEARAHAHDFAAGAEILDVVFQEHFDVG